jgi:long-chain acyl-CoA synthetase
LHPGEAGELVVKGPQVMHSYHQMPEETEYTLRNGWLFTGDIARMDEDGYFYLIDRKKELIKIGGLQVWPREIEEVIASHPKGPGSRCSRSATSYTGGNCEGMGCGTSW